MESSKPPKDFFSRFLMGWSSGLAFCVFGGLGIVFAFTYGLGASVPLLFLPFSFQAFLAGEVAFISFLLGGSVVIGRIAAGLLFAFDWIPFASPSWHVRLRGILFATLTVIFAYYSIRAVIDRSFFVDRLIDIHFEKVLAVAAGFFLIHCLKTRSLKRAIFGSGALVFVIGILTLLSFLVGASRMQYLKSSDAVSICLVNEEQISASIIYADSDVLWISTGGDNAVIPAPRVTSIETISTDNFCNPF